MANGNLFQIPERKAIKNLFHPHATILFYQDIIERTGLQSNGINLSSGSGLSAYFSSGRTDDAAIL